ncbi:universal stress protein [Acidisphaera sp. L21]|uniref:universal stress protein n=1 Tax=Acidisphaera sp. L21 TaxID=1641851 RepID=UPI00131B9902|nr:universal stress protein [Acidisphaera sp. L21]
MTYTSLMVHLDLGQSNENLLRVTADLAEQFGASVIGIAACQPMMIYGSDGYIAGEAIEQDRSTMEMQTRAVETAFRAAMKGRVANLQWRSTIGYDSLSDFIAAQARAADLLLIAPEPRESVFDSGRRVALGDLVMQIGRPVMVIPPSAIKLDLDQVVVGWKDTTETRRAVQDALPLLRQAGRVTVVEVTRPEDLALAQEHLRDVASWLSGHGVNADVATPQSAEDGRHILNSFAGEKHAGLMVTGAYGHNRVREWVLGGVTRDILLHPTRCSFLSH